MAVLLKAISEIATLYLQHFHSRPVSVSFLSFSHYLFFFLLLFFLQTWRWVDNSPAQTLDFSHWKNSNIFYYINRGFVSPVFQSVSLRFNLNKKKKKPKPKPQEEFCSHRNSVLDYCSILYKTCFTHNRKKERGNNKSHNALLKETYCLCLLVRDFLHTKMCSLFVSAWKCVCRDTFRFLSPACVFFPPWSHSFCKALFKQITCY